MATSNPQPAALPRLVQVSLPPLNVNGHDNDVGVVAWLLVHEPLNPYMPGYSEEDSKTAMQWMKRVLVNRLAMAVEGRFGLRDHTTGRYYANDLTDIVRVPKQFEVFSSTEVGHLAMIKKEDDRVQMVLKMANSSYQTYLSNDKQDQDIAKENQRRANRNQRIAAFNKFVQNALAVANAPAVPDPSTAKNPQIYLSGWRTRQHAKSKGDFTFFATKSNNDFYTTSLAPPPAHVAHLRLGAYGREVVELQSQLADQGYSDSHGRGLQPDGHFGHGTQDALKAFQRAHGLTPTGVVDPPDTGRVV